MILRCVNQVIGGWLVQKYLGDLSSLNNQSLTLILYTCSMMCFGLRGIHIIRSRFRRKGFLEKRKKNSYNLW